MKTSSKDMKKQSYKGMVVLALIMVFSAVKMVAQDVSDFTFNNGVRYSQWVTKSRLHDYWANTTHDGFAVYDAEGTKTENALHGKSKLDYVPGLVAKAIVENVQYYSQYSWAQSWAKPFFYSVADYGNYYYNRYNSTGGSLDDLNASKVFFGLYDLTKAGGAYNSDGIASTTKSNAQTALGTAQTGFVNHNTSYKIANTTSAYVAGHTIVENGWYHKSTYVDEMWLDGSYMGPALFAQLRNYNGSDIISDDWTIVYRQIQALWEMCWNSSDKLLYHAFAAASHSNYSATWSGFDTAGGVYHSASYWGRACGWYFLALIDILEQMDAAGLSGTANYITLKSHLTDLAAGLAARQDATTGCWYQLLDENASFYADYYNEQSKPTKYNYLESSASALFAAGFLKAIRLGYISSGTYSTVAQNAYQGLVNNFFKSDGSEGVHLFGSCRSAGLGGTNGGMPRDGSKAYYLLGGDVARVAKSEDVTEGKILGAFILAATEYERLYQNNTVLFEKDLAPSYSLTVGDEISCPASGSGASITYQWYKDDSPVVGATSATIEPAASGEYYCTATSGGTTVTSSTTAVTVSAAPATYSVTYHGNGNTGGTAPTDPSSPYASGSNVTVLSAGTLVKSGYTFNGWNTQADGLGTPYSVGGTISGISADIDLYAQWTEGEDEVIILNEVYNSTASASGYSDNSAIAWGGTASTSSKTAGDPNNNGAATSSSVACYSVKGNGGGKNITVSVTGVSKIIVYHESHASRYLELRDGSSSGSIIGSGTTSTYYTEVNLDSETDYTIFLRGTDGSSDSDFNVYAIKLIKASGTSHTVSFADGTCGDHGTYDGTSITQAGSITLPTVTPDTGWRFDGWYTNNNGTGTKYTTSITPASNTPLYAWYVKTYTVTYDGQTPTSGSAPTDASSPYDTGSNVTVLGNTGSMTKSYKNFVGWNTSTSGTVSTHYNADDTYEGISSDVTFYAMWHNQVTYDVASGSGSVSAVYGTGGDTYYGKSTGDTFTSGDYVPDNVKLTLTATPSTGYQFDTTEGWGGATSTKTATLTDFNITAQKGFHAHFVANTYTVTIDENTGSAGDASVTATYDAALPAFTAPTKSDNTLNGYYTETSGGTKVINADGTLVASVAGYTDGSGNWTHDGNVTLYAQWTPAGGGGGEEVICDFNSGSPSSAMVVATKGGGAAGYANTSATYDGTTYTMLLKVESETNVAITPTSNCTIKVVTSAAGTIKVDGTNQTCSSDAKGCYSYSFDATSGKTYNLTKNTSFNIVCIVITPTGGGEPTLSSIAVKTAPTKTTYTEGEYFAPSGLVITKTMSDASTSDVAYSGNEGDFTFSPTTSTALTTSDTEVTITYGGKSTTQTITVNAAAPTYSVTYNANLEGVEGSVPTDATAYANGATVTVLGNTGTLEKSGYTFLGWSTASGYSASYYEPAETFAMGTANVTLYAQWKLNTAPTAAPSSGMLATGAAVTVTAAQGTGQYLGWGGNSSGQDVAALSGTTLRGTSFTATMDYSDAGASKYLSAVATDGTFFSDVAVFGYTVGVATPEISCSSNTVTITSATDGASIYYTTDGSTPTDESTLYSAPFDIVANTTVKAVAIKSGNSSAVASEDCTYSSYSWPVSIDFTSEGGVWSTSDNAALAGASGAKVTVHGVSFRGTSATEFQIVNSSGQHLQVNSNGSTNHFFAIPLDGINGRIDIYVTAPYTTSNFKVRSYLDTANGTTVQNLSPRSPSAVAWSDDTDPSTGVYHYRIEDIAVTSGVLYLGVNSSSYKLIDKIRIETQGNILVASPASVTMGDNETATATVTNYSTYRIVMNNVPSYVTASFNPSTGELVITPKAIGTGESITFAVDTNGDGIGDDEDLAVPVTVHGITVGTNPTSAVYEYGASASPLTASASKSAGMGGTITYQWYKNTVNSTTGGTPISGATSASYTPSTTTASEESAFYYCVAKVASDTIKSQASDVAYVLTSNTGRYFNMANVAGNQQTSETELKITGQVVAGGTAYVENTSGDSYRYITRMNTTRAHTYVAGGSTRYFKVSLDRAIAAGDVISVQLDGLDQSTIRGLYITDDASSTTGKVEMFTAANDGVITKTYTVTGSDCLHGKSTFYIIGKSGTASDYFTNLTISTPGAVKITDPASETIQSGETPKPLTVTASDGTGDFSFQWEISTDNSSWTTVTGGDGTVTTVGSTSTFAPVALTATRYYRCTVTDNTASLSATSEVATITVTALTHGYYTPASYKDNKATYLTIKDNYDDQNEGDVTATSHYWSLTGTSTWGNKTISGIDNTSRYYLRIKKSSESMTFYVKDATAFSFITEAKYDGGVYYTYTVRVDDVLIGDFETTGQESSAISLNPEGSKIVISGPKSEKDIYIGRLTFYEKQPADIKVIKDGEAVTEASQYIDGGAYDYAVTSSSTGSITVDTSAEGYDASVATASYSGGVLTVTPVSVGTSVITIHQDADANYAEATTTLTVKIQYHTISIAFSYDKSSFKASLLTQDNVIPSGSLPVLTATYDDGREFDGSIYYHSDDRGIGYFGASKDTYANSDMSLSGVGNTTYSIKYGGGQGGARIYAYVLAAGNYDQAVAYFDLVVEDGTSNDIPKGMSPKVYQQYGMRNSAGEEVIRLTYGGYKYMETKTGQWSEGSTRGKYFVDGHEYYTRYGTIDALNEYNYQLKGMSDDYHDGDCPNGMWYKTSEIKPDGGYYKDFERVRPFNLPCRGSYIKFEPKKSGVLTAYVWQNGTIDESANTLGSKPRLGYWFDEDGWVQHPTAVPVTKQPLGVMSGQERKGRDGRNVDSQMASKWTAEKGDQNMAKLLKYKYCLDERPDSTTAEARFSNTKTGAFAEAYENPYYWGTNAEVSANLDLAVPKVMNPVPFHNGFLIPEAAYVKYTLNVVAGKSYYFYGMMTKIGYAGMNFVETDDVLTTSPNDIAHEGTTLHLQTDDDMTVYKIGGCTLAKNTLFDEVTLPSNYRKAKWNTICLPFALSENQVEEAFGKGTQLAIFNGLRHDSENHIFYIRYLRHVDQNILPGQPYLIYPTGVDSEGNDLPNIDGIIGDEVEGASGTRITFSNVYIDKGKLKQAFASYGNDVDADGSTTSYIFTGSYKPTDIEKYDIYNTPKTGELKRYMGAGTTLNTYHALMKAYSDGIKKDAITFAFSENDIEKTWEQTDDTPTEIVMVEDDGILEFRGNAAYNGKTYNMMGQEVDPTSVKGIILVNGKKVVY